MAIAAQDIPEKTKPKSLPRVRLELVDIFGRMAQSLSFPRSVGEIYGLLYLAPAPMSAPEICEALSISKGSVSTGTRQLLTLGFIRKVWLQEERKDYFEAVLELGEMVRTAYDQIFKMRAQNARSTTYGRIGNVGRRKERSQLRGICAHQRAPCAPHQIAKTRQAIYAIARTTHQMTAYEKLQRALKRRPRKWLVTGAAGFIGSHLVETLLRLNQRVVGMDNFATGHAANLDDVRANVTSAQRRAFQFIEGDITNAKDCACACRGTEFVLHQAALGSVPRSFADPPGNARAQHHRFSQRPASRPQSKRRNEWCMLRAVRFMAT